MVEIFPKLTDEEAASLEEFKKKHAACHERVNGYDLLPDQFISYKCTPSPLGEFIVAKCPCGATWTAFDGDTYETDLPDKDDAEHPRIDVEAIRLVHTAMRRPEMIFPGCAGCYTHCVEALLTGISVGFFHTREHAVFDDICNSLMVRWNKRANDPYGYESHSPARRILEAGGSDEDALAAWREEFESYLIDTYPSIAKECGLLDPEGVGP